MVPVLLTKMSKAGSPAIVARMAAVSSTSSGSAS
jgi:hypothetical protein